MNYLPKEIIHEIMYYSDIHGIDTLDDIFDNPSNYVYF
jgi:hypothetical protein